MDGEDEISGGRGRRIQRRAPKGACKSKPKRRFFTKERREEFLSRFAADCNAAAAARAVGVSENCVYQWRKKDPQFRAGFGEALDQGYARLEAEIVHASRESLKIRVRKGAGVRVGTVDAKTALAVLEAYRRSGGRAPGAVWPHPYDVEAVRARLESKMKALGIIGRDEAGEGCSTASRSPSPPTRGEEN